MKVIHLCCGQPMQKLSGTKATYICQQCGKPRTFNKPTTIRDLVKQR